MEDPLNSTNNEDEEYVEEEMMVYVDIEPTSLAASQIKSASCFKIVGDEKNAIIQVDNKFFEGEFDYSMGTHVFFEKDENTTIDPLYTRCDNFYKLDSKTNKTLKMSRVLLKDPFLNSKENTQKTSAEDSEEEEDMLKTTTRTYEQALNLFLPANRVPPRMITGEDERISLEIVNKCTLVTPQNSNSDELMNEAPKIG